MISARKALVAHVRRFVEFELRGLYSWGDAVMYPPEPVEKVPGSRPYGKWREVIRLEVGPYQIEVQSPLEHGPLGHVEVRIGGTVLAEGTIDSWVWAQAGAAIRSREQQTRRTVNGG